MRRKFLIGLIAFLTLVVGLLVLAHTRYVRTLILQYALDYLERIPTVSISVKGLDYDALRLSVALHEVAIAAREPADAIPFFQADTVALRFSLPFIFRRHSRIREIEIINPRINLIVGIDGSNNFPSAASPEGEAAAQPGLLLFDVEKLRLKNGHFSYLDHLRKTASELRAVEAELSWIGDSKHNLRLSTREPGHFDYASTRFRIHGLSAESEISDVDMVLDELTLKVEGSDLKANGRIIVFPAVNLDLSLQGRIDTVDLRALAPRDRRFSGKLDFEASARGEPDAITAELHVRSDDLQFEDLRNVKLALDAAWGEQLLAISSKITLGSGEVTGQGQLHPLAWSQGNHVDLTWSGIALEPLTRAFNLPHRFVSRTSGKLEASWSALALEAIRGRADIELISTQQDGLTNRRVPLSGRISAEAEAGKLTVKVQDLSVAGARVRTEIQLYASTLRSEVSDALKTFAR